MNPFEFVLLLVLIITVASLIKHRDRRRAAAGQELAELEARLNRLQELEQRVQVLEKIVTDRNYDLKRQFEDPERG